MITIHFKLYSDSASCNNAIIAPNVDKAMEKVQEIYMNSIYDSILITKVINSEVQYDE